MVDKMSSQIYRDLLWANYDIPSKYLFFYLAVQPDVFLFLSHQENIGTVRTFVCNVTFKGPNCTVNFSLWSLKSFNNFSKVVNFEL